jgi:hypothetical protein
VRNATILENFSNKGGALDFYSDDGSIEALFPGEGLQPYQVHPSNIRHLWIWIQVKTAIDDFRLNQFVRDARE